jgi:hypothetical protein
MAASPTPKQRLRAVNPLYVFVVGFALVILAKLLLPYE